MNNEPRLSYLNLGFRILIFVLLLAIGLSFLAAADFEIARALDMIRATGPLSFVSAMCILPLFGFPIAAFYLYAGSAFPWWQAWLYCVVALAVNISLAYPLGKLLLHSPISAILMKYEKRLPSLTEENHFRLTFLVRAIPGIPFFLQNYLLPVMGVRFFQYFLISWLVQCTFAAGMSAIPHLVERGGWIMAAVVLFLFLLAGILRRIYVRSDTDRKAARLAEPSA